MHLLIKEKLFTDQRYCEAENLSLHSTVLLDIWDLILTYPQESVQWFPSFKATDLLREEHFVAATWCGCGLTYYLEAMSKTSCHIVVIPHTI